MRSERLPCYPITAIYRRILRPDFAYAGLMLAGAPYRRLTRSNEAYHTGQRANGEPGAALGVLCG